MCLILRSTVKDSVVMAFVILRDVLCFAPPKVVRMHVIAVQTFTTFGRPLFMVPRAVNKGIL